VLDQLSRDPLSPTATEQPIDDAYDSNLAPRADRVRRELSRQTATLADTVDPGFFSSSQRLRLLPGSRFEESERRGYYIDLRVKAAAAGTWPPEWLRPGYGHVRLAQFGLGHFERYAVDGDDRGFEMARAVADHLLASQVQSSGPDRGGWLHDYAFSLRAPLRPPWLSAMAQGQGASLLSRLFAETGDARYAEGAELALRPMRLAVARGGVLGSIDGMPFLEEYPTEPQSHVLNGAVFALWGVRDVALLSREAETVDMHEELVAALVATSARWDMGRWSRYDLFPRRPTNIASSFYHQLHISQLNVLHTIYGESEFEELAGRFTSYQDQTVLRYAAFAQKAAYRIVIPRRKIFRRPDAPHAAGRQLLFKVSQFLPIRRP
jgi:hypothetical protein